MSRYDSHLRRLGNKLKLLEQQKTSGSISKALREYGQTGELPHHEGLKQAVLRIVTAARLMYETLPWTTRSETQPGPHPTTETPIPQNNENRKNIQGEKFTKHSKHRR